jgi:wyosine [tRNA(Phe)-imidazoG37] synthetase (radical SAM superfamily)
MPGFLFHDVIFGPVRSRRLGLSLGINLLPKHYKFCSFNCIYCECGWTPSRPEKGLEYPSKEDVSSYLEHRLKELAEEDYLPDALTFAGNGEPTLHPFFGEIVDETIRLRNLYAPRASVTVLSNGSMIQVPEVFIALQRLDNNIQKLDAGTETMFQLMNSPIHPVNFAEYIGNLAKFEGNVIIQSMFLRGIYNGQPIDNTLPGEVEPWLLHISRIRPKMVMLYSIARATPAQLLENVPIFELEKIAGRVRELDIPVSVYH